MESAVREFWKNVSQKCKGDDKGDDEGAIGCNHQTIKQGNEHCNEFT
jgi:hypothetical protein